MAGNIDSDLALAVALAESDEACSDEDYKPSPGELGLSNQQLAFDTFRVPKKQQRQRKKKADKKEGDKGNNRVEVVDVDDSSGDDGGRREKKVRKQVPTKEITPRDVYTVNNSVQRATSLSMAELDSFRYTGGARGGTKALLEAVPVMMDNIVEAVDVSAMNLDSHAEVLCRSGPAADHAKEFLVIDLDSDEVVELSDDTQFSVLLSLCGAECEEEEDELKTDVPDVVGKVSTPCDGNHVNSVSKTAQQPSNLVANGEGRSGIGSGEELVTTPIVDVISTKLMGTVSEGSVPREQLLVESAFAPDTDSDDADQPDNKKDGNEAQEEHISQEDQFCDDFISSMMTQQCVSQPDEVKAPHRMPPSPLQNISNLQPRRVDANKQRLNVKSVNQAASRKRAEPKCTNNQDAQALDRKKETGPSRGPAAMIPQAHPGASRDDEGQNKENVGVSPCGITSVEPRPFVSGNAIEGSVFFSDGREPVVEDVLVDGGEAEATIKCPICGEDITGISVDKRLAHTNSCLDNLDAEEQEEGNTDGPASDQVKTWLEKLNLSRFVSLFVEQEIDWDTIPWLTEEDLVIMGITTIGPRRKIFQAIQELKRGSSGGPAGPSPAMASTIPPAEGISRVPQPNGEESNNVITNYFPLPPDSGRRQLHETSATDTTRRTGVVKSRTSKRPRSSAYQNMSGIPEWMCIPGTPFRVDAFQHLGGGCSHWFLTHFHTDHYQGLTRGFRYGHIFCSSITARLVNLRIGVSWEKIMIIPLHEKVKIAGVDVTFIDANHCPGSVMILFEPPDGKAVLHTGDFRFCREMASNSILQTVNIHTLVLDTTYCDPQYDFPTQETVIRFVIEAIQAEMFNSDTLFLIGTYTIGKERLFLEVAKVLKKYVYIGAPKKKLLDCMDMSADDTRWLTCNELESFIHVVPLWSISSFKRMNSIARHYQGRYKLIVAFSPTGWSFGRGKKKTPGKRWKQGTMIRYEVPYSEHCSFSELREFLKFIGPEDVIPSVPNKNGTGADAMIASLRSEER